MKLSALAMATWVILFAFWAHARADICGDADGNGAVTVTDGVNVLRAAAGLDGSCTGHVAACDADGNGTVTVTDGVNVLRAAANLPVNLSCPSMPSPTPTATPGPTPTGFKRVFATSTMHDGGFGGISGADALCTMRAVAAGLNGSFKAWLSVSSGSPSSTFAQSRLPYGLVDGTMVALDWSDLVDGTLAHRIDEDENGTPVAGDVWTGTDTAGNAVLATCNDWSSSSASGQCGSTAQVGNAWTASSTPSCTLQLRVYCFEQ